MPKLPMSLNIPIVCVSHLEGHVSAWLKDPRSSYLLLFCHVYKEVSASCVQMMQQFDKGAFIELRLCLVAQLLIA